MNLYGILGIDDSADKIAIKKAYHLRAQESHPDKGGDEEIFKLILLAYQTLIDDKLRAHYDKTGEILDSPESEAQKIRQEVISIFHQIIKTQGFSPIYINIFDEIRGAITDHIEKLNQARANTLIEIQQYQEMMKRIIKGSDLFQAVLEDLIIKADKSINQIDIAIGRTTRMLDHVKDLEYKNDPMPPLPTNTSVTMNWHSQ
jgi:DnaJ-class molecular chaperone